LTAWLALRSGRIAQTQSLLTILKREAVPPSRAIEIAQLESAFWSEKGDDDRALASLRSQLRKLTTLGDRAGSSPLRLLIAMRANRLCESAFHILLGAVNSAGADTPVIGANAERVWEWLLASTQYDWSPSERSSDTSLDAGKVDRAISADMLSSVAVSSTQAPPTAAAAQHELLRWLARQDDVHTGEKRYDLPSIADFQATLGPDAALLAYVDGRDRGAMLWVTSDAVRLVPAAPPARLRPAIGALRRLLRDPQVPLVQIEDAAAGVSRQVFGWTPSSPPPKRLYVLADSLLDAIPWAVLQWPDRGFPLVEETTVSTVRLDAVREVRRANGEAHPLYVVTSAQTNAGASILPGLANAGVEAQLIERAANNRLFEEIYGNEGARTRILASLAEQGAWLHFAGHGLENKQRVGYTGFWLESDQAGSSPVLMSWLDILQHRARAELVVLDACQLADGGDASTGNLSFAAAISRAGAEHVVAALWPVSDAAAAIWVPSFYASLADASSQGAAEAMRTAQLRLRRSRAFAHPFYWSSLIVQSRIHVAP
jgi:hypothetical protein